jgi:hypothetical protein
MPDIEDMEITLQPRTAPFQEKVWRSRLHIAECRGVTGKDCLCEGCTERVAAIAALEAGEDRQ